MRLRKQLFKQQLRLRLLTEKPERVLKKALVFLLLPKKQTAVFHGGLLILRNFESHDIQKILEQPEQRVEKVQKLPEADFLRIVFVRKVKLGNFAQK